MIEAADKYEKELETLKCPDNDFWYRYELPVRLVRQNFVSVYEGGVIGKISIVVNEPACAVTEISQMVLSGDRRRRYMFGKDVMLFGRYLMGKYRKITFAVMTGAPIEEFHDRRAKRLGWNIAGTLRDEVRDGNGEWHDVKIYEWVNPDWRPENA
ncbi:MAG: hypothetical protein LBG27_00445 [Spirochaetaceae bacterium]|jgi:hypothetical protein|nr:hypothetical protein [Spirochaetaceae bacterium]